MIELFFRKKYFYPNDYKKSVFDIDFPQLWENNIRYIMLDLDNTLIPYDESDPKDNVHKLFADLKDIGFEVYIISNNQKGRVKAFAKQVNVRYVYGARKPFKLGFRRAVRYANHPDPATCCLIGDQFMTDVLGGNRMGFFTIAVDTLKRSGEKWFTKISKHIERRILHRLKKNDPDFYHKMKLDEKR